MRQRPKKKNLKHQTGYLTSHFCAVADEGAIRLGGLDEAQGSMADRAQKLLRVGIGLGDACQMAAVKSYVWASAA